MATWILGLFSVLFVTNFKVLKAVGLPSGWTCGLGAPFLPAPICTVHLHKHGS